MTLQRRFALFFLGCIGLRTLLVVLAANASPEGLRLMAVLASLVAVGFTVIFLGGYRRYGPETGGERIWWNALRPVHAALYALFAYLAWTGDRELAWKTLLVDVSIGLVNFVSHHTT